ncbi:unnamed protein product [Onchocerca flexuosa]|uniref:FERM domain-containing protein n=1 Tax=Onchocerca flexuosa TaxID=387005 RepID=A0A183HED6_9BILA|nr:unnamed protein product [Onchocerca flexuosa]
METILKPAGTKNESYGCKKNENSKINVWVAMMDAELEFTVQPNTTVRELFDKVVELIDILEIRIPTQTVPNMVEPYEKVVSMQPSFLMISSFITEIQIINQTILAKSQHRMSYPENVQKEIIRNITLRLLYLQAKDAVLSDEIHCSPQISILTA